MIEIAMLTNFKHRYFLQLAFIFLYSVLLADGKHA